MRFRFWLYCLVAVIIDCLVDLVAFAFLVLHVPHFKLHLVFRDFPVYLRAPLPRLEVVLCPLLKVAFYLPLM